MHPQCRIILSLPPCATRGTAWSALIAGREQSFGHPVVRAAAEHNFAGFLHEPDVWRPQQASPYRSYVQGPSAADHCNLYVRLEHLTSDIASLEEHLGFRIDVGHINASARDQDYRTYYTIELCDHMARKCADDIARFEYAF